MKKLITELINLYHGKPALVCGLGPSLLKLNKEEYKDNIIIACNEFYRVPNFFNEEFKPCFFCGSNFLKLLKSQMNFCTLHNISLFIGIPDVEEEKEGMKYVEDILNYNKDYCFWNWRQKELQVLIKTIYNMNTENGYGESVVIHAINLALLLGCNPITLTGIDFKYDGETTHAGFNEATRLDVWQNDEERKKLEEEFKCLSSLFRKNNINVYNLSSEVNKFPYELKNYE